MHRHGNGQRQGDAAGYMTFEAEHRQRQEEKYDRDDGREGGDAETAERGIELLPGLHMGWPLIVVGQTLGSGFG